MDTEEIVLVAKEAKIKSVELWHVRMGKLNSQDTVKLRSRALGIRFEGEPCFCRTCVLAKMKSVPFQNQGQKDVTPKQNIRFDVSGPYPLSPDGFQYSLNAICKATGKRWRQGGRYKSDAAQFLQHLLARLNNTASPPGKVETLSSDHGVEVLSNAFRTWLNATDIFHMTAAAREPNYNTVI